MLNSIKRCFRSRKHLISIPAIILFTFILLLMFSVLLEPPQKHLFASARLKLFGNEIQCYRAHHINTLPDISEEITQDNNIYFHETSCTSYHHGRIVLIGRQACAVESAALLHPNRKIYLLFTSPGVIKPGIGDTADLALNAIISYENIHIAHINFEKYINNTPLQHLYTSRSIELSKYPGSHASDVLRYLTLWKYGGVYLDLDVIVTKSLDDLGANFAGSESSENVAAGVLGLNASGTGRKWAQICLEDLARTFSGSDWGHNGPGVITRLLRRLCKVQRAKDMKDNCQGFKVMPPKSFYPIPWVDWDKYFNPNQKDETLQLVKESYAIHVWNKHSHSVQVAKNSAYATVAKKFCPRVYQALQDSNF